MSTGIIIVDHGSRRAQSNEMLERVAELFAQRFESRYAIVEPAHMELAEPSIAAAYARCVKRGALRIVVCPFFLGPGKHWTADIPKLTAAAASKFPATRFHVAPPLGVDDLILDLLAKRAGHCDFHHDDCDICRGTLRSGDPALAAAALAETSAAHPASNGAQICGACPFNTPAAVAV